MTLTSQQIRKQFTDFFASKDHKIVPSAPMVIKNDPTLMFTNAGMNQFKDIFLGNREADAPRVADSQKCLRVSGKHNDLEEVGRDTYHHTMFEMLGNWSFGNYFKAEAIAWAWELLHDVFGVDPGRLYATVFEGDPSDGIPLDEEARSLWTKFLPDNHILLGNKKDNFWEMGETGPCGPCSEIHIDLRCDAERASVPGNSLVNKDHPLVVEIWNLVFIQFNRLANGSLVSLPKKHVDTGMGFERLCMALQNKTSNYDTDVFQPIIGEIEQLSGLKYGVRESSDIAFRVVADHLRAVAFSIADGQLPSNVKAGYVIRRILRRAIRYGYTHLQLKEPFINRLVSVLVQQMGSAFPELQAQQELITKVIAEEELSFLRTLETGIHLLDQVIETMNKEGQRILDGKTAFLLYDTYGFPVDLTALILAEQGLKLDQHAFHQELEAQKNRSRDAARLEADDWVVVDESMESQGFRGYDTFELDVNILKYRKIVAKEKVMFQVVLDKTPFYPESGGQVGDTGFLMDTLTREKWKISDTRYENQLVLHFMESLPQNPGNPFHAVVDAESRKATERNHSATHLLHLALKKVLGAHVEQKGSLVHPDYLRFDFSHFGKMSDEEILNTENMVNEMIMKAVKLDEHRNIPLESAKEMGAVSLFGEKYGAEVRVIRFGESMELCGGTHVNNTGQIGVFRIHSEGAVAAGIRRIEAVTGLEALRFFREQVSLVNAFKTLVRNPKDPLKGLQSLIEKVDSLEHELDILSKSQADAEFRLILDSASEVNGVRFIGQHTSLKSKDLKDIAFRLRSSESNLLMVLTSENEGKAGVAVFVSDDLIKEKNLHAAALIKSVAPIIKGGGGGQDFFATAGGKNVSALPEVILKLKEVL